MFNDVVIELERHTFHAVAAAFDGAGENRTFAKMMATRRASEFLDGADVPFNTDFPVAMDHPVLGAEYPIFLLSDTPHEVKKVVNALESSNNNDKKRKLQKISTDGEPQPLCLDMAKDVWLKYDGLLNTNSAVCGENPLKRTKLTREHFHKNAFSRMRVPLAAQVLSNTMCRMIDSATTDKPSSQLLYEPLRDLCSRMNDFLDIMNGRRDKGYANIKDSNAKELRELGEIMKWFEDWYDEIQDDPRFGLEPDDKKYAFLPEECWYDLQSIIKGVTAFSVFYLRKFQGHEEIMIVQRRLMQDIVEHHFAHVRQSCGGSSHPNQEQAFRATCAAGTMRLFRSGKGNSGAAPMNVDPKAPLLKR